ncbi:CRISPR-associated endoribonuclease Cas2 [Phocoenobacter uteri]|uniref:CRISPR-associated endoribonuclease Cas2 n=1 Tax=Phocoenobacter uteri TaxID=146806 RepID=A0A379C9R5_9PAST|nr:CRISPR-associated endonuclease Cas2 [Phocoenobacter uteri]MDG6882242.1 CRISPR-associated endonuclease Cas2 [Phocoenobacter uteri]SUB58397.1 CRISPR-associated endoribonuclease Cas2 [Phocoenobacter uteri]
MQVSRLRYLIAYDVCDPKRLYKVHKKVEAYAIGGQKSFYECWLTKNELNQFKKELIDLLELGEDRIFIFQIPPNTEPQLFGKAKLQPISPFLII